MKTATLAYLLVVALALTLVCTSVRATEPQVNINPSVQVMPRINPCIYGYDATGKPILDRTCEARQVMRDNLETLTLINSIRPDLLCAVVREMDTQGRVPGISLSQTKFSEGCEPRN